MSVKAEYQELYKKIGLRVFQLRTKNKLTQEELALECGMEATNLSQIERGTRNPTSKTLYDLCKAFDITLAEFFTGMYIEKYVKTEPKE